MVNDVVYTSHLKWHPIGEQKTTLSDIRPVFSDIIINKLRPKQHMDIELLVHKGIGRDHAKFSPVCTAFYRLLPTITLLKDFTGQVLSKILKKLKLKIMKLKSNFRKHINCKSALARA